MTKPTKWPESQWSLGIRANAQVDLRLHWAHVSFCWVCLVAAQIYTASHNAIYLVLALLAWTCWMKNQSTRYSLWGWGMVTNDLCITFGLFIVILGIKKKINGFFTAEKAQNQNCYWWHDQMTLIHQDLWWGKLVPSRYKRSELSNRVFCTFSSRKESICKWFPISNSLGETALVNVSISKWGLKCQRVMLSDMPIKLGGQGHS